MKKKKRKRMYLSILCISIINKAIKTLLCFTFCTRCDINLQQYLGLLK